MGGAWRTRQPQERVSCWRTWLRWNSKELHSLGKNNISKGYMPYDWLLSWRFLGMTVFQRWDPMSCCQGFRMRRGSRRNPECGETSMVVEGHMRHPHSHDTAQCLARDGVYMQAAYLIKLYTRNTQTTLHTRYMGTIKTRRIWLRLLDCFTINVNTL